MDTYTRLTITAVVRGLQKSGALPGHAVDAIAAEIEAAAKLMEGYNPSDHAQMLRVVSDLRGSKLTGPNSD